MVIKVKKVEKLDLRFTGNSAKDALFLIKLGLEKVEKDPGVKQEVKMAMKKFAEKLED